MDIARALADSGAAEGTVIQAGTQTGGRGRRGNQWESPLGNLYQSLILRPGKPKQEWGQLSFVIAVALAGALVRSGICENHIQLKWPNDVLLDERKAAGILIEASGNHVIIGTGVNIATAPESRGRLSDYMAADRDGFRDMFLDSVGYHYTSWQAQGFETIREEWMRHAYRLGQDIQARLKDAVYEGVFQDIDDNGTLLLAEKDGTTRKINAGEILYVPRH